MSAAEPPVTTDPVEFLAEQVRLGSTGILTVSSGKLKRLFCLEKGRVVFARSNLIEEQFGEYLVREGLLTPGRRAEAQAAAAKAGVKPARFLLDEGILAEEVLLPAVESHARKLLVESLGASKSICRFAKGRPNLEGELTVALSCIPLILEHAEKSPAGLDAVLVGIGPPNTRPLRSRRAGSLLEGLALDPVVGFLDERADGKLDVRTLVAASPGSEEATLRALYGLLAVGVLERAADEAPAKQQRERVSRDEVEARIHAASGVDHYQLLGLESNANADEVRDAYYHLARRYHPDRFRTGPLEDLLAGIERYFTQVTEAYNTLWNPDLREQYDEELSQRGVEKRTRPAQDARELARQNYLRAKVMVDKKRFQEAVTFLENAIELFEAESAFHLDLGRVLALNPRRRDDSERHLQRAIELDPTAVEGRLTLGDLYLKIGRKDDAARMYDEVLRWEPTNSSALARLEELRQGKKSDEGGLFGGLFKG